MGKPDPELMQRVERLKAVGGDPMKLEGYERARLAIGILRWTEANGIKPEVRAT